MHRIGRTARAGRKGSSIGFCSETDYTELERIEKYLNSKLPVAEVNESYLEFPKGEFTPVFPEETIPGEKKYQDREKRDKPGRGRDRDKDRKKQHPPAKMSHPHEGHPHPHTKPERPKQDEHRGPKKTSDKPGHKTHKRNDHRGSTQNQNTNKNANSSRRNLFDKDAAAKEPIKKKSLWNKILSVFKKS